MPLPLQPQISVDTFFKSNDYNDFIAWMDSIRTSLLALNRYNPQSNFGTSDTQALQTFIDANNLTQAYQEQNIIGETLSDVNTNSAQTDTSNISSAVQTFNTDQMTLQDNDIDATQTANAAAIVTDGQVLSAQIQNEIKNQQKAKLMAVDANNPIPKANRINANPFSPGYTGSFQTTDANGVPTVSTVAFPLTGQEYDNHAADITNRMANLDTFEIFTGYKAKNNSDTPLDYDFKSWAIVKGTDKSQWKPDPQRTFTPDRPFSDYINEIIKRTNKTPYPGAYKFFIEKLHGRYSDNSPYKMNKIKSQTDISGSGLQNLSNRMVFFAYIENYADTFSASWNDYNFSGRAEQVPAYKSTKRDITLEFLILSDYNAEVMVAMEQLNNIIGQQHSPETQNDILENIIKSKNVDWGLGLLIPPTLTNDGYQVGNVGGVYSDTPEGLWSKLTFLAQCCYPFYRTDGKMKEQPLIRLRIADFYDVVVYINSLSHQMTAFDGPLVDMNPSSIGNMPFGVKVTLSGTILHNYEPSSTFYGFYNRREFDTGALDPSTGVNINLQQNKMQLGATKNSPTNFSNTFINDKQLDTSKVNLAMTNLQKNLVNFSSNFTDLKNVGTVLIDSYMKQKTKASIEAFRAVSEAASYLQILYGIDPLPVNTPTDLQTNNKTTNTPNTDSSLDGTTAGKFTTAQQANQQFKNAFENPITPTTPAPVANTVEDSANDLQNIAGTNIFTQTETNQMTEKKSQSFQPKTLQDIIDYSKNSGNSK